MVKNLSVMQETRVQSWVKKITWRREWLPTPVFLPGKFNGERSLAGHSPWDRKELDMTVFHSRRGNSKAGLNRQKKEAANLKRGCETEEHKK